MKDWLLKHKYFLIVLFGVVAYSIYFCVFTILRYRTLYASYFDLGIMQQTVYNTFQAIVHHDSTRFLELTDPYGIDVMKRMAIHNDILLAFLAPFYAVWSGPETLLVIQTVVLALGALFVFKISEKVFGKESIMALVFSVAYLFYPPMHRANIFDFHAVTLATTFLLGMFYFWLIKKYRWSFVFFLLSILSKEQVALTTLFFGGYIFIEGKFSVFISFLKKPISTIRTLFKDKKNMFFALLIMMISAVWFVASIWYIIPAFRGGHHFAMSYYEDVRTSPSSALQNLFDIDSLFYVLYSFGPLGFLSVAGLLQLLISLPEFAINLLSSNVNMHYIIYHYTSVITPWIFISAIYGSYTIFRKMKKRIHEKYIKPVLTLYILAFTLLFAFWIGPLPFSKAEFLHPFIYQDKDAPVALDWSKKLDHNSLKVMATGHVAPLFASRRYFYGFSKYYSLADYIVLQKREVYNDPEKDALIPAYEALQKDDRYIKVYSNGNFEVYKKVIGLPL